VGSTHTFSNTWTSYSTGPSSCRTSARRCIVDNKYATVSPASPLPTMATLTRREDGLESANSPVICVVTGESVVFCLRARVEGWYEKRGE